MKTHKHNDVPITFPQGQRDIYRAIVFREHTRVQIECCTQYGKTHTVGVALLPVTCIQHKIVCVLAPTSAKAKLIMRDYIDHLGDDPLYYEELEKDTKLDRLRMEENKERIMLKGGGGLFVISLDANNSRKSFEKAMGAGADIVILDEGALISDEAEATVYRMIAGKGKYACYIKIGNPFTTGHFKTTSDDPTYYKIRIDWRQAVAEGRYTMEFVEGAKKRPLFDVLYENKFPDEKLIDERGYRRLLTPDQVNDAIDDKNEGKPSIDIMAELQKYKDRMAELQEFKERGIKKPSPEQLTTPEPYFTGKPKLGCDIARGGKNKSTHLLRFANYGIILNKNSDPDLMAQVPIIIHIKKEYYLNDEDIAVDDTGVGGGVTNRLHELDHIVNGVKTGESAVKNDKYANLKAELNFLAQDWLINEKGLLAPEPVDGDVHDLNDGWRRQLKVPKFKENSSSKLKMEPKEDLQKQNIESPDDWDALCLSFSNSPNCEASDFVIV